MIMLFSASILAGLIIGAPFGATGALVADAALTHDKVRVKTTIFSAVAGDTILAFLLSFAAGPTRTFLSKNEKLFFLIAGLTIMGLGIFLCRAAACSGPAIGKTASSVSVFFITLLHPGTVGALILTIAVFTAHFSGFESNRLVFVYGVAIGSFLIFLFTGLLFWKIRQKADKFLRQIRYGFATVLILTGAYLIFKGF